ncbi:MAG: DsbA family oxidoreductase [Pseudomonadota bacterium]
MITLDIISDPICPWCYIGKAHFEKAVEAKGSQPFDIFWRPFQLNPDMPEGGMNRKAYLERKFGVERAAQFYKQIEDTAVSAGLDVRFDLIETTPNTFDAHRLIRWSRSTGAQSAVVNQLFVRYFERGENIGDRDLLLDVGESVGMERDVVKKLYDDDADREMLTQEEATAREIGVNGVPTFIVAGKHVVTGAQPPELWENVLEELGASLTAADVN